MKVYGYCRISTRSQSIERQVRNILAAYPDAIIIKEVYTGTKTEGRDRFTHLLEKVTAGDTIVFDSVSRMSRNADEGVKNYLDLVKKNVDLVFLKEHHIDTATYKKAIATAIPLTGSKVDYILKGVNDYLITLAEDQVRIAFDQAEKEVTDLHQRVKEGMETARDLGKQIGQVQGKKLTVHKAGPQKELIRAYSRDFDGTLNDTELLAVMATKKVRIPDKIHPERYTEVSAAISRNSLKKYKAEMIADLDTDK